MHSRRYTAFISYRHADNTQEGRRWAEWLHRALERYIVPPDLIGSPNLRGEPIRDSLYPIFRDEDELPANADLATGIRAALEVSDHLIVLCSPRSAVSPWVRKEVREFKELGRSDRILAIILAGEPNADDPAKAREGILRDEECFCEELRFGAVREDGTLDWTIQTEPLAADLRPIGTRAEGFVTAEAYREHLTLNSSLTSDKIATRTEAYRQQLDHALIKVIAGLLGVALGTLKDRDAAHRTALAEAEAAKQRQIAEKERKLADEARQARDAAQKNSRLLAIASAVVLMLALLAGWSWNAAVKAQTEERKQRLYSQQQAVLAQQRGIKLEEAAKKQMALLHQASMADFNTAVQMFGKGEQMRGIAHLAGALSWDPENKAAAQLLYSTLALNRFGTGGADDLGVLPIEATTVEQWVATPEMREIGDYLGVVLAEMQEDDAGVVRRAQIFMNDYPASAMNGEVRMKNAEALFRLENYPHARNEFEVLVVSNPDDPQVITALFLAAESCMRFPTAEAMDRGYEMFGTVADHHGPLEFHARLKQADMKRSLGAYDEAVALYENILTTQPPVQPKVRFAALIGKAEIFHLLGERDAKNFTAAIAIYDQVIATEGASLIWKNKASWNKARALEDLGQSETALAILQDILNSSAASPIEKIWFARAGFAAADILEAQQQWRAAFGVCKKMASVPGPHNEDAKKRASRLRLEHSLQD